MSIPTANEAREILRQRRREKVKQKIADEDELAFLRGER